MHQHVQSRKHRKFAENDANFLQLDFLLSRVRRRTVREVEDERREQEARHLNREARDLGDDELAYCVSPQDVNYTNRSWADRDVDADGDVCVD